MKALDFYILAFKYVNAGIKYSVLLGYDLIFYGNINLSFETTKILRAAK